MNLRYFLLPLVAICASTIVSAQSDFDLSQRWFNESVYNPAATGNSFTTGIFLHSRAQWLKTDGAPITNAISADTYVESIRSAFGVVVTNDQIGYWNSWSAKLSYAYYIPFGNSSLSAGLSGYLNNRSSNVTPDYADNPGDVVLGNSRITEYSPDFDIGLEYKGPFKLGLSVRHLLNSQSTNAVFPAHSINFWSYLTSRFNILNNFSAEPIFSYTHRRNINRIEGGAIFYFMKSTPKALYNDRFWVGGLFQFKDRFAILAGIKITPQISLGYSFDYGMYGVSDLTTIARIGTHELFLSWHFDKVFYKDPECPAYKRYSTSKKNRPLFTY